MPTRKAGKKSAAKSSKKKKGSAKPTAKRAAKPAKSPASRPVALDLNHAMLYSVDVDRAAKFYSARLGFKVVDDFRHEGRLLYSRLRAPSGSGTIAIHLLEPGKSIPKDEGVRLYFEVKGLDEFCRRLEAQGRLLDSLPKTMPWGWRHAYLHDPDGHELSLYWAGDKRFERTMQK